MLLAVVIHFMLWNLAMWARLFFIDHDYLGIGIFLIAI
jgi:hypothetical protein